jgi:hypothetical protein
VRTTLTLEDDVAAKLASKARKSGQSFKAVVNDALRRGLAEPARHEGPRKRFVVKALPIGLRADLPVDNIGDLLERVEGPHHR